MAADAPRSRRPAPGSRAPASHESDPEAEAIEIPWKRLSTEALRAVVEEFVTRSGTDYGRREKTLDENVADVVRQLERGEVRVFFDPVSETVNLVPAR